MKQFFMRGFACALAGSTLLAAVFCAPAEAQEQRYVIADQDASGPGGSDMMSLLVFLQSPKVNLLGITVVTGDSWRDPEVAHALRLLEIVGRTDVKVYREPRFRWCVRRSGPLRRRRCMARRISKERGAAIALHSTMIAFRRWRRVLLRPSLRRKMLRTSWFAWCISIRIR